MKQQNMKRWSLNMKEESFRFLLIGGFFVFVSCGSETSGDPAKLIVNTWRLSEFTPAARFPMPDSVRQEIITRTVLTFTEDGKFTQTGISRKHSGTYSVSEDGKQIIYYHDERDVPFTETVLELSSKRMKVVDQNGNRMVRTN